MMLNKTTSSVDLNYWLKGLNTSSLEIPNYNSMKVPKVLKPTFCPPPPKSKNKTTSV